MVCTLVKVYGQVKTVIILPGQLWLSLFHIKSGVFFPLLKQVFAKLCSTFIRFKHAHKKEQNFALERFVPTRKQHLSLLKHLCTAGGEETVTYVIEMSKQTEH